MASDAPTPHSPPMPMPNSARRIRNVVKFGAKPGRDFDHRVEDQVDHHRQAPAVAVGQQAEDERPHRAEPGVSVMENATPRPTCGTPWRSRSGERRPGRSRRRRASSPETRRSSRKPPRARTVAGCDLGRRRDGGIHAAEYSRAAAWPHFAGHTGRNAPAKTGRGPHNAYPCRPHSTLHGKADAISWPIMHPNRAPMPMANDSPIPRPNRLFLGVVLALSSAAGLSMLAFRAYYCGTRGYSFMVWNLFLAWLPLAFAGAAVRSGPAGRATGWSHSGGGSSGCCSSRTRRTSARNSSTSCPTGRRRRCRHRSCGSRPAAACRSGST